MTAILLEQGVPADRSRQWLHRVAVDVRPFLQDRGGVEDVAVRASHALEAMHEERDRHQSEDTDARADGGHVEGNVESIQTDDEGEKAPDEETEADGRSLVSPPELTVVLAEFLGIAYRQRFLFGYNLGRQQSSQRGCCLFVPLGQAEHARDENGRPDDEEQASLNEGRQRGQLSGVQTQPQDGLASQNSQCSYRRNYQESPHVRSLRCGVATPAIYSPFASAGASSERMIRPRE